MLAALFCSGSIVSLWIIKLKNHPDRVVLQLALVLTLA
jgi:hypothetical protein